MWNDLKEEDVPALELDTEVNHIIYDFDLDAASRPNCFCTVSHSASALLIYQ